MKELISGGVALGPSSLNLWETANTQVVTDINYRYLIRQDGYMKQSKKLSSSMNSIKVVIDYESVEDTNCYLSIAAKDSISNNVILPLLKDSTKLETSVPLGGTDVTGITLLLKSSGSNVFIDLVSVQGDILVAGSEVDFNEFIAKSILYGTDANKPKMR